MPTILRWIWISEIFKCRCEGKGGGQGDASEISAADTSKPTSQETFTSDGSVDCSTSPQKRL